VIMKFAIFPTLAAIACLSGSHVWSSESAPDSEMAVETLRAGLEVHPDQAVVLFQDSLQTNPDCARALLAAALDTLGDDAAVVTPILYAARLEFPEDDAAFAEVMLETLPELAGELRAAFAASPEEMLAALGSASEAVANETAAVPEESAPSTELAAESAAMDEEIRDAIARVTAKTEGKAWPEQEVVVSPVQFKKSDEVRIPRKSRQADESSLFNHLMLDRTDEREIAPGLVKIDDGWSPSGEIRLDEAKFSHEGREASTAPLEAKVKAMSPAGSIGLPKRPVLPRSSVYYIPPAAGSYESTIDLENGDFAPPALVIRPESASPTSPK
jgi:hypothetical protein